MDDKDIIELAVAQVKDAEDDTRSNRNKAIVDLEFTFAEDQWDPDIRNARGDRPCLNANDLPIFLDQVVGSQRANKMGIKVLPVDSDTDPKKAEVVGGYIRNIEHVSNAPLAYNMALEAAVAGGYMGATRVVTQFENDDLFDDDGMIKEKYRSSTSALDQTIRIVPVENPLNVLFDPKARLWHRNDGDFCFLLDDIPLSDYPGENPIDFDSEMLVDTLKDWCDTSKKTIRIAEWFNKEQKGTKTVYLILNDSEEYELVDRKPDDTNRILKEREVADFRIVWRKISGTEVLEGPIEIPGRLFPIVPCWGKEININGERVTRGMFRYVKDVHRMDLYTQSAITEAIALAPKAPYIGTVKMFENHEPRWRRSNTENLAYLASNPDPDMPGMLPKRQEPPPVSMALIEQSAQRKADKRDIIGLHQASLGQKSNETSGEAIRQRRSADDSMSYAYIDNSDMMVQQVGRVILGMIPTVIDTPRLLQIMGADGKTQKTQAVNEPYTDEEGKTQPAIDFRIGKHDLVIQTGPGYATQRRETLDLLIKVMQYAPQAGVLLAPIILNLMEVPDGDRIEKVLMTLLPPEARAAMEGRDIPEITPEQVTQFVQEGIEAFKQGEEGQRELLKTQQEKEQTEQEKLQTEQARFKMMAEAENLRRSIDGVLRGGQ